MYFDYLDTDIGRIFLLADSQGLRQLTICSPGFSPDKRWEHEPTKMQPYTHELTEYFEGKRKKFTFSIAPQGTDFQIKVWQALRHIPFNHQQTYQQIAQRIGLPHAASAVGMARNVNPIPIVIPCHRVEKNISSRYHFGDDVIQQLHALETGQLALISAHKSQR
ncbi:methylated-DNA--[protein]-cysteine S-methyltransferase [Photobacterium sanguinicancri]|uniref:6-O-methylguanine DNA methyltransferase n=2 Tax=Photobacterium sanguinicancri TaxID=875932 RepID=A0ABX4FXB0_9GAMM|nr:methylated-DNA--[protein]-cysteine S-methyltransferase [Photobacterium sanguinicancri]KXI23789.1 6-O-methylguanine DNA methyltransferase [Photobacterium sanguinicancri]OZS43511.1 6-O-methylguanine DNA methyltransferase [Photobacterium sanguinicancri]